MLADKYIPPYVNVVRMHGPFLFGAAEKLEQATADLTRFGQIVVLKLTHMTAHRRHGTARHRSARGPVVRFRPVARYLRSIASTRGIDPTLEVDSTHWTPKHSAAS